MVLEEYVVLVRGQTGHQQRRFTYWVDPHKKPNIKSVLKDFKRDAQIQNVDDWKLCTLAGTEIRFLADYADRILVLTPSPRQITTVTKLPTIRTSSNNRSLMSSKSDDNTTTLSKSSSTLPSLSSGSNSSSVTENRTLVNDYHNSPLRLKRSRSFDYNLSNKNNSRKPPRRDPRTMIKQKEK